MFVELFYMIRSQEPDLGYAMTIYHADMVLDMLLDAALSYQTCWDPG